MPRVPRRWAAGCNQSSWDPKPNIAENRVKPQKERIWSSKTLLFRGRAVGFREVFFVSSSLIVQPSDVLF